MELIFGGKLRFLFRRVGFRQTAFPRSKLFEEAYLRSLPALLASVSPCALKWKYIFDGIFVFGAGRFETISYLKFALFCCGYLPYPWQLGELSFDTILTASIMSLTVWALLIVLLDALNWHLMVCNHLRTKCSLQRSPKHWAVGVSSGPRARLLHWRSEFESRWSLQFFL